MKLLTAVDFSPQTRKVLETARQLATALKAELWLVHAAAPEPVVRSYGAGARQDRERTAEEYRQEHRLIQEAAADAREVGIEATGLLVQGPPARMILKEAADLEADMIIVGSHGFGAVLGLLLGSVSKKILRKANCPVLVVPADRPDR